MPPKLPPPLHSPSGATSPPTQVTTRPPPPPMLANRFRKDPRFASLHDKDIEPVWTRPFGQLLLAEMFSPEFTPCLRKATLLDVMCHAGYPGLEVLRRFAEARLVAIDPSAALIELARRKAGPLTGRRVFFRTESAEPTLPFDKSVYDLVISNLGLHDAAQPRMLLRELSRVAKPGAVVLATLPLRGSFGEFYTLLSNLIGGSGKEASRLESHLQSLPDAAALCEWAVDAGLSDISVVTRPFSLLFASGLDLFFAPVIEYGPLSAWKAILGERGPEMQAAFHELRARIDRACQGTVPFVLTVRAACLRARKPSPPPLPSFEEDPENAPTSPGG